MPNPARPLSEALAAARRHHLDRLGDALRRPGLYGRDELAERLLLEALAAVNGRLPQWAAAQESLRERDAFAATGVAGAYRQIVPESAVRDATASMYAELAHRLGWLRLDRTLAAAEFTALGADVGQWTVQDRTTQEVLDAYGPPSVSIGRTTLAYAVADPGPGLICFHTGQERVLAVRHRPGHFPGAFSWTPWGLRRRPHPDNPRPGDTVWIFTGTGARFASGVFDNRADGLGWVARHGLTGTLTEYAIGGAYDVAVRQGRFTPTREHHGRSGHIEGFSPGLGHIHLTDGRPA